MAAVESAENVGEAFVDRDLSWLEFDRRVLHEALDPRNPLLERVKFLAIFSNNLDEFFMKRIALLKRRIGTEVDKTAAGGQPYHRMLRVREVVSGMLAEQAQAFTDDIRPALRANGILLLEWDELTELQRSSARDYFRRMVFPVLTPLAVDPGHPFPFISNLSTSLGVLLKAPETEEPLFARVKVPDVLPQWIKLPDDPVDGKPSRLCHLRLVDLVRNNLEDLFPGMTVLETMPFRVTRSVAVELDDDDRTESLAELVEEELRLRRFEHAVRLEYGPGSSPPMLQILARKLGLAEADLYPMTAELDFTDLFAIAAAPRPDLKDPVWHPLVPAGLEEEDSDIFALIRKGDILVHHPYESFDDTVARFIRQASEDPKVVALKMTVYRVGSDTQFLDALVEAAELGKQVACLVEVTARFDERQNLQLAESLEKAGVHVVYGVVGLKTHSKVALVVRQDDDGLRAYVHIGTGNYHVKTARLYTDLGLFTCDPALTDDVINLFHYLTGRSRKKDYAKLLVAPVTMRDRFLEMIDREIDHCRNGRPAKIVAKMNQLEDRQVCDALIRASQAGVSIRLIVRGFCTLLPGRPGLTDNIRIQSIIGRFLEHSRIFFFGNGKDDPLDGEFYIGSADWMSRNLSDRVEAITPVEKRHLRERLWEILMIGLEDQRQAWDLQPDGSYVQRRPEEGTTGPRAVGTHQTLMELTKQRGEYVPERT